jgi:hypothetical protein
MPSDLVLRGGLQIFISETDPAIKHRVFQNDRVKYESKRGFVYCDAKNRPYAQILDDRWERLLKANPAMKEFTRDTPKADLIEVILYQYRHEPKYSDGVALKYLEQIIEHHLRAIHGVQFSVAELDEDDELVEHAAEDLVDWSADEYLHEAMYCLYEFVIFVFKHSLPLH